MPSITLEEAGLDVSITEIVAETKIVEDVLSVDICEKQSPSLLCPDSIATNIVEEHLDVSLIYDALNLNYVNIPETHLDVSIVPDALGIEITEVVDLSGLAVVGQAGDVFIYDVTCAGIIADKVYDPDTVPADVDLLSCTTDTDEIIISFFCEGANGKYSPTITCNGVTCTDLAQHDGDRRNFYGTVTISTPVSEVVFVRSDTGHADEIDITRAPSGPEILTCIIGSYPGTQTAAKADDQITISGTTDTGATEIRLVAAGGFEASSWEPVIGETYSFTGTVNSASGLQTCTVEARNTIGTIGDQFDSTNSITLDQDAPVIGSSSIGYPGGQQAFKNTESGTVTTTVTDFTSIVYSSPHADFNISNLTTYENVKNISCTNPGDYNDSVSNFRIVATKTSNDTSTTSNVIIEVADVAPVITISQADARLRSGPAGEDHSITATSDQNLSNASLNIDAPVGGTWQGLWNKNGKIFTRNLRVSDSDGKGSGLFGFNAIPSNNAGTQASITGTQVNGGFVPRDLTLEAFNNEISVSVAVVDYTKVQMGDWSFTGSTLTREATINSVPPIPGYFTIDQQGSSPHTFRNLDTNQTDASSQATTIADYEEII